MTREEVIQKLEAGDKNFKICNLSGLDLRDADLCGADLRDADLRGADLRHADLRDAYLRRANLCDANLCGADIDYACWPLWCGGLHVKIDKRIACQLAYHFCNQDCDDPEYIEARNAILNFANQFHRVQECGLLEPGNAGIEVSVGEIELIEKEGG